MLNETFSVNFKQYAKNSYLTCDIFNVRTSFEENIRSIFPDLRPQFGAMTTLGQAPLSTRVPIAIVSVDSLYCSAHDWQIAQSRTNLPFGRHVNQGCQVDQSHTGKDSHSHTQTKCATNDPLGALHYSTLPHFFPFLRVSSSHHYLFREQNRVWK